MVKIYGTNSCGVCDSAKKRCEEFGVNYKYYDCSIRKYYLECVEGKADMKKIPHIFVNNEYIGDYKNLLSFLRGKANDL